MKQGFTLIEMLLVLIIITIVSNLSIKKITTTKNYENIELKQLKAMATGQRVYVNDTIWFNHNGNINHGQTLKINGKTYVFQLGFGRYRIE